MEDLHQMIVNERIGDLRREAESLRIERRARDGTPADGTRTGDGARVRLGNWLIGVGLAVSGSRADYADRRPATQPEANC
jgi:hypothetical protein